MGIFSKIAQALKKTKENFSKKMYALFAGRALDDDFYDELEAILIGADVGVTAAEQIIEDFRDACYREKVKTPEQGRDLLKRIMTDAIDYEIAPYEYPLVILVAGVNGVGKTTALGKLAKYFTTKGKSVVMAAADTFRAAAAE